MDQQSVSKETLNNSLSGAVRHINRNIYEWRHKDKIKSPFVMSYTEVKGLARNWLIRSLRDKIGHGDADRLFKGVYLSMDDQAYAVKSVSLAYDAKNHPLYHAVENSFRDMDYQQLRYDPADYLTDGMSEKKPGFDPYFYVSLEEIRAIKF